MKAVFNLNSDEIFIQTSPGDDRLPTEQWEKMKSEMNFRWFPGSKQMVAKWTPYVEDFVTKTLGLEIDDEFRADDPEARIDRYEKYADNATESAERIRERVDGISERFAGGQPILVGHHSERGARADAKKIENGMRKSISENERAAYWRSRAEGAIARAMQKEDPGVIYRRINGPEGFAKRLRGHLKDQNQSGIKIGLWQIVGLDKEMAMKIANIDHVSFPGCCSLWHALQTDNTTAEQAKGLAVAAHESSMTFHGRWVVHLQMVMDYNQALYLASGGIAADASKPEVGGAVKCWASHRYPGQLAPISKVNKKTICVMDNWGNGGKDFERKIEIDKCSIVLSKAEFEQWKADGTLPERYQKKVENA